MELCLHSQLRRSKVVQTGSAVFATFLASAAFAALSIAGEWVPLFSHDGVPEGWSVRHWADVKDAPPQPSPWIVKDGVLHGSQPRGTWLVSEREFGDFALEFEWQIGEQGNSGVGLRFPAEGDPAFAGMEVQMVDPRYYGDYAFEPGELTGAIYKAQPPRAQMYRAGEWNRYEITCRGEHVRVVLNGELLHDLHLDAETRTVERGAPLSQRPRKGRIGFQELSRGGGHVLVRGARIRELE